MTYDRKIMKLDLKRVREVNLKLTKSLPNEYIRIMPDKD